MPHIVIHVSRALSEQFNMAALVDELHETLSKRQDANIQPKKVMSYAVIAEHARVGTQETPNNLIDIKLRLLPGRSDDMKANLCRELADVAKKHLKDSDLTARIRCTPEDLSPAMQS